MKAMMNQMLESLRQRVAENLATIKQNEAEIRKILTEPLSNQRSYNLSNRYAFSKKIIHENIENLKIQNMIVAFLNNYKEMPEHTELLTSINNFEKSLALENCEDCSQNSSKIVEKKVNQRVSEEISSDMKIEKSVSSSSMAIGKEVDKLAESIFELTTSGKIAFNKAHPKFNDEEFYNQLLDFHTKREEYEICSKLVKTRK
jgi:hypothetical protein